MRGWLTFLVFGWVVSTSMGASADAGIEFNVLCIDGELPTGVRYVAAPREQPSEIIFAEDRRAGPYPYVGPREVYFFRDVPDANGQSLRFSVATATLSPEMRRPLLVFAPGGNAARSEEYSVFVLDDAPQGFDRGTIRFFNVTDTHLVTRIGDEEEPLHSWTPVDVRFRAKRNERTPFGLMIPQDEVPQVLLNSDLLLYPDRRYLMIILPPLRPDSLRYRLKLLQDAPAVQPIATGNSR